MFYRIIRSCLAALMVIIFLVRCGSGEAQKKWNTSDGYVPDSKTAVQIAQIILVNVYGEKVLKKRPFIAVLKEGVWIVDGSLEKGMDGGVPHIEIQKSDGKIINVIHGK